MMQNCRRMKRIFRFLLRLITLFIWKGKRPYRVDYYLPVESEVSKATTKVLPKPTKLVVKPKKPRKKSSIKKKKKKVIIRKKKRGRKNAF